MPVFSPFLSCGRRLRLLNRMPQSFLLALPPLPRPGRQCAPTGDKDSGSVPLQKKGTFSGGMRDHVHTYERCCLIGRITWIHTGRCLGAIVVRLGTFPGISYQRQAGCGMFRECIPTSIPLLQEYLGSPPSSLRPPLLLLRQLRSTSMVTVPISRALLETIRLLFGRSTITLSLRSPIGRLRTTLLPASWRLSAWTRTFGKIPNALVPLRRMWFVAGLLLLPASAPSTATRAFIRPLTSSPRRTSPFTTSSWRLSALPSLQLTQRLTLLLL